MATPGVLQNLLYGTTANSSISATGVTVFFGNDMVDGWPVRESIKQGFAFIYDPHSGPMQRLFIRAASAGGFYTAVAPAASATVSLSGTAQIGRQFAWTRGGSDIPLQSTE